MKAIVGLIGVIVVSMAFVAVAIFGLGDGSIMVSPPESVVETFSRHIVTQRYSQAWNHLSEEAKQNFSVEDLKDLSRELEHRLGGIYDVRGLPQARADAEATAVAVLRSPRTKHHIATFRLNREQGLWLIRDFDF